MVESKSQGLIVNLIVEETVKTKRLKYLTTANMTYFYHMLKVCNNIGVCFVFAVIVLLCSSKQLHAQGSQDLIIAGLIQNSVTGFTPVPNHPVNIVGDPLAPPTNINLITNASGIFQTIIPNGSVSGFPAGFTISAQGCGQNFQQSISNTGGTTDSVFVVLSICYSSITACNPGFISFNDPMGPVSMEFTFQDTSLSGNPVFWHWDFGDGFQDSGSALVTHEYLLPGFYEVCETIEGLSGCTSTICDSVAVGMPGPCNLSVNAQLDTANQNLTLDIIYNAGSYSGEYYLKVDYGDFTGVEFFSPDSAFQFTHTYLSAGFYDVIISMINADGCADSAQIDLVVPVQNCQAGLLLQSIQAQTATFIGSFNPFNPGDSLLVSFNFGDGNTQSGVFTSNQFSVSHFYALAGPQLVCISITDPTGCTSNSCLPVVIPPSCNASFNVYPDFNTGSYLFQSTSSYVGSLSALNWDMGNGVVLPGLSGPVNYQYTQPGVYNVCLSLLTQNGCSHSYCDTLVVGDAFDCAALITPVLISDTLNSAVRLDLGFQSLFPGELMQFSFSWGDGSPAWSSTTITGQVFHLSKPLLPGNYQACLSVANVSGCTDTLCYTINYAPDLMAMRMSAGTATQNYQDFSFAYYRFDSLVNEWVLQVESSPPDTAFYHKLALPIDTYVLQVRLDPTHPAFPFVIPSYFPNERHWQDAGFITAIPDTSGQTFREVRTEYSSVSAIQGSSSIGGDLVLEDGLTPVTGAGILLLNDTGWPLKAYRTGTDGLWFFDNLPTGTYYVYPEVVNKITYPIKINIITPGSEIENQRMTIQGILISGTENVQEVNASDIYPNPFTTSLTISGLTGTPIQVQLKSATGQVLRHILLNNNTGFVLDDLESISPGIYFLEIQAKDRVIRKKLIKE